MVFNPAKKKKKKKNVTQNCNAEEEEEEEEEKWQKAERNLREKLFVFFF